MKNKNIVLVSIAVITLLTFVVLATYAYFANNANTDNIANVNALTERNNMVFDTLGGDLILNVTAGSMAQSVAGTVADQNTTTLTVNFTANTDYDMVCSYDIVYEWTSDVENRYTAHTTGVTDNEFTIQATLASNAHVYEGTNNIASETDLSTAVGNQLSATVVSGAQIDSNGVSTSTAVWTIGAKFYNVDANQSDLSNKNYTGRFKVTNVSCVAGTVSGSTSVSGPTAYWFDKVNCTQSNPCSYGTYPGTTVPNGAATEHYTYIGQDASKYYACANVFENEVCLSQPYTQYGLTGHTAGQSFTTEERASAKTALFQIITDSGIDIPETKCSANSVYINCSVGNDIVCSISYDGEVYCMKDAVGGCLVNPSGTAYCY